MTVLAAGLFGHAPVLGGSSALGGGQSGFGGEFAGLGFGDPLADDGRVAAVIEGGSVLAEPTCAGLDLIAQCVGFR